MNYTDFDKTGTYKKLQALAGGAFDYSMLLTAERVRVARTSMAAGLYYSWAAKPAGEEVLEQLQALADEQELLAKYRALLEGELVNTGEKRKVLHHLTRSGSLAVTGKPVLHE